MSRPRGEDGTALVEFVWLAILLLVPLVWIVLSVFEVQRGAFATSSAARSAARAYSLAETDAAGEARARAAIRQALDDQGGEGRVFRVAITCGSAVCHAAGEVITVRVWTRVDLPMLPGILGGDAPSFALDAAHTVPVGQFRDL